MKKIILAVSFVILLTGGIAIMVVSAQSIKSVDRKIFYQENPILEESEILDVDGTTYVPLRVLCKSTKKEVEWEKDANGERVQIEDEHWYYERNGSNGVVNVKMPRNEPVVPDAETAFTIGDTILRRAYRDSYPYDAEASEVVFDEERGVWVVYGKLTLKPGVKPGAGGKDVPTVVVIRKTDGQVIALS